MFENTRLFQGYNLSQGIRIIQSYSSFLLLKYTYIQGYVFQLRGVIIKEELNYELYKIHLRTAQELGNTWHIIHNSILDSINREI